MRADAECECDENTLTKLIREPPRNDLRPFVPPVGLLGPSCWLGARVSDGHRRRRMSGQLAWSKPGVFQADVRGRWTVRRGNASCQQLVLSLAAACMLISKVQVDANSGSRGKERPTCHPATAETGGCGDAPSTQFNNSTEDSRPRQIQGA
jgi:hypothetical protein